MNNKIIDTNLSSRVKICALLNSFYPFQPGGGRETGLYYITKYAKNFFDISVVSLAAPVNSLLLFDDAKKYANLSPAFSWVGLLRSNKVTRKLDSFTKMLSLYRAGVKQLKTKKTNILVVFDASPASLRLASYAKSLGVKVVLNVRTLYALELKIGAGINEQTYKKLQKVELKLLNLVDAVLCNGEDTYQYTLSIKPNIDRAVVVYNGVDTDLFNPNNKQPLYLSKKFRLPKDTFWFINNNPLRDIKGTYECIEAFSLLPDKVQAASALLMCGDGDISRCKSLVEQYGLQNRVFITGRLSHDELAKFLANSHVAIHPIIYSAGTTHASLESIASGLPVIAYNRAGLAAICKDGVNGMLISHPSPNELKENMLKAFQLSGERLQAMSTYSRSLSSSFSWSSYVEKYRVCIESVLSN